MISIKDGKLDLFVAGSASGLYLGNGNGTFTLSGNTLGSYSWVSAADFNGDGRLDVLLSTSTGRQAYLANSSGGFTAAGTISLGSGQTVVADFNGDGKPDAGIGYTSCSTHGGCHTYMEVYLGVGDGTFTPAGGPALSGHPASLIAADFNRDGKQDVLAAPTGILFGNGDGTFQIAAPAPLGITPAGAIAGDINNDGQLDIAAIDKGGWLYLSLGNHGSFADTSAVSTVPDYLGPFTVLADVNGDGKLDQISYGTYPTWGLIVQLGNGDGTFQAPIISGSGTMGGSIAVGDFNNDGKLDVVVNGPNGSSQTYSVFLGNGDGTFQSAISGYSNQYVLSWAVADVNGDGKLDLLATVQNGVGMNVYLGNGDGTFGVATTYPACFSNSMVVADFNQDGKPDAAVACGASLEVLIGNGNGTFQPYVSYGTGGGSVAVAGDFNGDGKIDIANGTYIYLGNGDGTFQALPSIASVDPLAMVAGDFNGDGKTDLAMLIYPTSGNPTRLFYSNGDGTFADSFLLGSPASGMAAGDLNGDGSIDLLGSIPGVSASTTFTALNVPAMSLAPGQLNFPNEAVGSSESLTFTVSNPGVASLTLGATATTGDFAVGSNACPATLTSGMACSLQVTFTPTVMGLRTGVLTIATDNFGGSANLALSGNGAVSGPAVQVLPSSLTFAGQLVGTSSASQVVTVTSAGAGAVTFSGFATNGDFTQTNNCPPVLNPSAICYVFVTFTPTASGTRTGSLVISDNAPGGSQTVSLAGTGTAPAVVLSPTSLTFATQVVGTTSSAKTVTLTNTGTGALTISNLTFVGANPTSFAETNTCGSSVAPGASCFISVSFKANRDQHLDGHVRR